jgi:hypothetical protein
MSRGLDHVVHAVRDLDAAAGLYARLGFHVGARNGHPWGTHNRLIQLSGFFVELLTVAKPEKLGSDVLSRLFGRFNHSFLEREQGLSLLILESRNAAADAATFKSAGIAASDVERFEREGRGPDGSAVRVAFSLAFARDAQAPETSFAVCQQHCPESFWNPDFQLHANTVSEVASAVLVAQSPERHRHFLSAFTGVRNPSGGSSRIEAATARGEVVLTDASTFRAEIGAPAPDASRGARIAAIGFRVRDRAALTAALQASGVAFIAQAGRFAVPAESAMGAILVLA